MAFSCLPEKAPMITQAGSQWQMGIFTLAAGVICTILFIVMVQHPITKRAPSR